MPENKIEKKLEEKIEAKVEKDVEKRIEKGIEGKVEKRVEQKIESKLEKKVEAKVEKKLEKELSAIAAKSSISIHVDKYDFIFSDFDPRPFSQRALSDDFLREAKKFAVETKPGVLELSLLIPEKARHPEIELVVKKRLREHFKNQHLRLLAEKKKTTRFGITLSAIGFSLMVGATMIASLESKEFLPKLVFVIFEPAGWFSLWYGLDNIFYFSKEKDPDLEFYEKMSKAEITFSSY